MVYHLKMAKEVMEVFPKHQQWPWTTKKEMAHQRKVLAMEILTASVFDKEVKLCHVRWHNHPAQCHITPTLTGVVRLSTMDRDRVIVWKLYRCDDQPQCKIRQA
ncbi:hypothetical protein F7725_028841 [Dissostichus mawsoni]|uniref:Uncharacterized protein n=1 Tax=Dissostichus mawsoni TaxID=36200 RepID=A0A7J5XHH7_DISMA|nr:hypothetical protein F7725_028841 [Dissostichus mawsoni]